MLTGNVPYDAGVWLIFFLSGMTDACQASDAVILMTRRNFSDDVQEQIAASVIEDAELAEMAVDAVCPECGDAGAEVVSVLSPEEVADESAESYKTGLGGAALGGIVGAPLGPVGVAVGMASGAFLGAEHGREKAKKERLEIECPCCGYVGGCS